VNCLAQPQGHEVVHLRRKFAPNTKDVDWIPALSQEGNWIVVSGDLDIIRTRAERPVWRSAGLTGFFLKKGWINIDEWEQASKLMQWWPVIITAARIAKPGSTFGVPVKFSGRLEQL
jgi:hypothetical protein